MTVGIFNGFQQIIFYRATCARVVVSTRSSAVLTKGYVCASDT